MERSQCRRNGGREPGCLADLLTGGRGPHPNGDRAGWAAWSAQTGPRLDEAARLRNLLGPTGTALGGSSSGLFDASNRMTVLAAAQQASDPPATLRALNDTLVTMLGEWGTALQTASAGEAQRDGEAARALRVLLRNEQMRALPTETTRLAPAAAPVPPCRNRDRTRGRHLPLCAHSALQSFQRFQGRALST
ncbi:MAG: hypothetical protein ACR2OO_12065 [Thermomicrobiales bacterium]